MNKYRGSNFEDYLREKGISEEVATRAKRRWEVLRTNASVELESRTESSSDPSKQNNGFFYRIRCGINHLFSQLKPMKK